MSEEIDRIRQAYEERDKSDLNRIFTYHNPAFAFHMQEREWGILRAFRDLDFRLIGAKVFEAGCGTGHILQRFVEFGAEEAYGIDLIEQRVAIANRLYPNLHIQQGNAAELPYADNTFEVVTQFMCISSVLDDQVRHRIANEMYRTLKPGGIFMSYDLRPPSMVFAWPRTLAAKVIPPIIKERIKRRRVKPTGHITPIKPLGLNEIRRWELGGASVIYTLSLEFKLAKVARYSRLLTQTLSCLPWLRSAYLVVLRKPSLQVHDDLYTLNQSPYSRCARRDVQR